MDKDRKRAVGVQEPIPAESAGTVCPVQSGVWPWKRCLSRHCPRQDSGLSYPCDIPCVFSGLQMADLCSCWKQCQQLCVLIFRRPPCLVTCPALTVLVSTSQAPFHLLLLHLTEWLKITFEKTEVRWECLEWRAEKAKIISFYPLLPRTLKIIPPWFIMGKANHF